ncbi:MAG: zinc ABC transporter substrate-binding protein, partial [Bacteroidota bacterium]
MKVVSFFSSVCLLFILVSCTSEPSSEEQDNNKLKVVCTTGMLGDMVENLGGDLIEVVSLMGPGVDPHLYKATPGDLKKLREADVIIYNGWHLEGKMVEVLEKLEARKPVFAAAERLPSDALIQIGGDTKAIDPHVWFNVSMWKECASNVSSFLVEQDAEHRRAYEENLRIFSDSLSSLNIWVEMEIEQIPEKQRVLITAHDAFSYFGEAYGIEVRGLQGISTVAEFGIRDVSDMVNFITERGIKAVFVESSIPQKALEAVVNGCAEKGHTVNIGGTLFSDAMGESGTPEGTYIGMVKSNVTTIVEALK